MIEELNKNNPKFKAVALLDEFYKKYGHTDNFEELRNKGLSTIKEKIKIVCKENKIPQIHEVDSKLWEQFLTLLGRTRHLLVHPNPDMEMFNELCKNILSNTDPFIKFPNIASGVISHFYNYSKLTKPEYLENNTLFNIKTIDLLF